ncbi:VOC family protein [Brachyspira intermedia]
MLKEVMHIGITVSNIERSINFYRDVLGLTLVGEALMEGKETDALFAMSNCKVKIAYLNGSDNII